MIFMSEKSIIYYYKNLKPQDSICACSTKDTNKAAAVKILKVNVTYLYDIVPFN